MEVYVFGVVFILILLPILYFIPIQMDYREKVLIAIISFLLAEIGLFLYQYLSIWKATLILVLLLMLVVYFGSKKLKKNLAAEKNSLEISANSEEDSSNDSENEREITDMINKRTTESPQGNYDLGQEAIDRLLADLKGDQQNIHDSNLNNGKPNTYVSDDEVSTVQVEKDFNNSADHNTEVEDSSSSVDPLLKSENDVDFSELAQSIDADVEIDFEKQLETSFEKKDDLKEIHKSKDDLLKNRSDLFEKLDNLEVTDEQISDDEKVVGVKDDPIIIDENSKNDSNQQESIVEVEEKEENAIDETKNQNGSVPTIESEKNILDELMEIEREKQGETTVKTDSSPSILEEAEDDFIPIGKWEDNVLEVIEPVDSMARELDEKSLHQKEEGEKIDENNHLQGVEILDLLDHKENQITHEMNYMSDIKEENPNESEEETQASYEEITSSTHHQNNKEAALLNEQEKSTFSLEQENITGESPTNMSNVQRQMLLAIVEHMKAMKPTMKAEQFEHLVRSYMHPSLPDIEYYTFAYMLIEHYISQNKYDKLIDFIHDIYHKFEQYLAIKQQLDYLLEIYSNH